MNVVYQFLDVIRHRFSFLKAWQALGLAILVYGIVRSRSCQVSKIGEELFEFGQASTIERRLRRWISNSRINVEQCCAAWMQWVWGNFDSKTVVLLVDETKLSARLGCMMVAVAYEGRAIPLVWRCYKANSAADYPAEGQVQMIMNLLEQVYDTLPANKHAIVMADRGISHSSAFIKALQRAGYDFLLRVKGDATFHPRGGGRFFLNQQRYYKKCRFLGGLFANEKQVQVQLLVSKPPKGLEPWFLVCPHDVERDPLLYAQRMWEEACFKDLKSGGWRWDESLIMNPDRASRLLVALTIAYGWMLTQGTFVLHSAPDVQRTVWHGKNPKYSLFRLGLRYFKQIYVTDPSKLVMGLFFAPLKLRC